MNPLKAELQKVYLDWVNNWLTRDRFAEYYGLTLDQAHRVIELGRDIHEGQLPRKELTK